MTDTAQDDWPLDFYGDPADDSEESCPHSWSFTGTAYGGDDPRYHGEGRVVCRLCGADGDG